ncbi:MAG: hypothetical protein GXY55_16310 [Phycisphaerae bacterium]|nr:hypothetical protein [Phycisphaerae bacterium]
MSGSKTIHIIIAWLACSFTAISTAPAQTTWYVDDDNCPGPGSGTEADPFCSIQRGIDEACGGDTIEVLPGTYNEAIDFLGKAITVRSSGGPEATTIDAPGLGASMVEWIKGQGPATVLEGFTVTGWAGTVGSDTTIGGGMRNSSSSPTVTDAPAEIPLPSRWMDPVNVWQPHTAVPPGPAVGAAEVKRIRTPAGGGPALGQQQGRVAVIIESSIYDSISASVTTYLGDLANVGFSTTAIALSGNAEYLRNTLIALYGEPESLVGAVLIGELPYVIYEMIQDWGGGEGPEYEDFPCDMYFMDMNGQWEDQLDEPPVEPGNGKLDTWSGDTAIEIWVSRMRTANLGAIGSETGLLSSYFARNHVLRRNLLNSFLGGLVYDDDDWEGWAISDTSCLESVFGAGSVVTISNPEATTAADYIANRLTADYHLDLIRSHGSPSGHGFYRADHSIFDWALLADYTSADPAAR